VPALYNLFCQHCQAPGTDLSLPESFAVIGVARREKTDESFRAELRESVERFSPDTFDGETWRQFAPRIRYHRTDFENLDGFKALGKRLADEKLPQNCLFYLAVQPDSIITVIDQLRASGLARPDGGRQPWSRVIIEKPFGRDLASARALNERLRTAFSEKQVFRIDHYLGKETVQNILVLRFANSLFEPLWNHKYLDHVQITMSETIGVETRGHYYEQAGAIRDIVQNHVMQLLSLVAMEPPASLDPDAIRDEKVQLIRSLRPIPADAVAGSVVRGQYAAGEVLGKAVPGYHQEEGVAPDSGTETFVAFRAFVDNWRWAGVPFYIRTGKRMPARVTEISVHFKPVPQVLFNNPPYGPMQPNVLAMRIQPNEGIALQFQVKRPGAATRVQASQLDFSYAEEFGAAAPEAYQRLLLDAALGDATLFTRNDEVEAAWQFVDPIIHACEARPAAGIPGYAAGTWGPSEADALIESDGRRWTVLRRHEHHATEEHGRMGARAHGRA